MNRTRTVAALLAAMMLPCLARAADAPTRQEAAAALRKASDYFRQKVSTEGGYLWRYSADLSRREGESTASDTTVWVQPPGTPAVGMTFLQLYQDTGDRYYLEAARDAAQCLVRGQLASGGWDYRIEFEPERRRRYAYRADGADAGKSNTTTLDDNTTQSALRLLIAIDEASGFNDAKIHEAAEFGLTSLVKAQYPNGAWPQRYSEMPNAADFPVKKAGYPESWSRTFPGVSYQTFYTFNDGAMADVIELMFEAGQVYGRDDYTSSGEKGGDFMLLAQMPAPQPAWAQQYNTDMHPAWARKFEPPAVTGGESQGVMRTLMMVYEKTGDKKYLKPVPEALAYLRSSLLKDGRLARFYELRTNRPLYFTLDYQLTYSDADMPTHYAFKIESSLDRLEKMYQKLQSDPWEKPVRQAARKHGPPSNDLIGRVREAINALDDQGRWLERGLLAKKDEESKEEAIITTTIFIKNARALGYYLASESD